MAISLRSFEKFAFRSRRLPESTDAGRSSFFADLQGASQKMTPGLIVLRTSLTSC